MVFLRVWGVWFESLNISALWKYESSFYTKSQTNANEVKNLWIPGTNHTQTLNITVMLNHGIIKTFQLLS